MVLAFHACKSIGSVRPTNVPYVTQLGLVDYRDLLQGNEAIVGAIVSVDNVHWCAVVRHSDTKFYVDSQQIPLSIIENNDWIDILQRHPNTYLICAADSDILERASWQRCC